MKSVTFEEHPQKNGRKYVTWKFVADDKSEHSEIGLRPGDYDPSKDVAEQAARWDAMLADAQARDNARLIAEGREAEMLFTLSTKDQAKEASAALSAEAAVKSVALVEEKAAVDAAAAKLADADTKIDEAVIAEAAVING